MILEEVIEKAAYARPGYMLAAFKEAALPVYVVTARVLTLEKKPISPIEEACLKAVDAGLVNPAEICQFLGLPIRILNGTLASLNAREQISYIRPLANIEAQVHLTAKGRTVLDEAQSIEPEEHLVRIVFDPLLKKVVFLQSSGLFKPKEVKDRGWMEIPLCGEKRPEVEDIPLGDIDKVVQRMSRNKEDVRELLAVRRIERRELQFTPCVALYYRSNNNKDVQVAFYQEEGASVLHENAFSELGGPELIGAKYALEPPVMPPMQQGTVLPAFQASSDEIAVLEQVITAAAETKSTWIEGSVIPVIEEAKNEQAKAAMNRLKSLTQRPLRCHEHPKMLLDAIIKSEQRLLIISPWITHYVVNDMFIRSLEALLRNGVDVYIGYGISDDDMRKEENRIKQKENISLEAQNELDRLRGRFDNLSVKFVGNTHRKLLVSDNKFAVITSFNWLSFKGDPKSKARDEYGFLVSEAAALEEIFQDGLTLMKEGYDHPSKKVSGKLGQSARP